jgi:putative nucleotidyltransferase with HDIG domain
MPVKARIYIAGVAMAGLISAAYAFAHWTCADPVVYCSYLLICALASVFKVSLPGIPGTISTSYIFLMLGVVNLSLGETLTTGLAATLVQSFWRCKARPKAVHLLFNCAGIMLAVASAYAVFHSAAVQGAVPSPLVRVFLAAAVYFFMNTWSIASVIAFTGNDRPLSVWKSSYLWSFAYYLLSASIVATITTLGASLGAKISFIVLPVAYVVYRSYRLHVLRLEQEKARAEEERKHAEEMSAVHLRTIQALALAIEAKDALTHKHLQRVQVYALEIGRQLGLSDGELRALQAAAILHDIGKIAVPEHIISKPGRLTPTEFARMKVHPVVGGEILDSVGFPYPVAPIVRSHHERWDGSGYPDGLKGEQIPIGARILSAVDCLDALASDRPYRRALPLEKAMAVVAEDAGKGFDPRVVAVLQRNFEELEHRTKQSLAIAPPALSKDLTIARRAAPAAGYASSNGSAAAATAQLQALDELLREIGGDLAPGELFSILERRLRALVPFDCLAVYLCREGRLRPVFVRGENANLFAQLEIPVGRGLSGWVAEHRRPLLNGNPSVEPGRLADDARFSALRSALAVPFESSDGFLGVLALYHKDSDAYHANHLRLLVGVQSRLALALEQAIRRQDSPRPEPAGESAGLAELLDAVRRTAGAPSPAPAGKS